MKIQIDRFTNMIAGVNTPATPLYLEIEVNDNFNIIKTIEEITGYTEVTEEGQEPIPITQKRSINFNENSTCFSLQEVLETKYKSILEDSICDYIIADMFITESDLDIKDKDHRANTGYGLLQLLPKGQAKTKAIALEAPALNFTLLEFSADEGVELYLNDKKFVDGKVILAEKANSCIIKFVSTMDKPKMVRAYAIGY